MTELAFKNPRFVTTAVSESDYPLVKDVCGNPLIEIAVGGRSNVGKSSLLNHLFQTKNLVKTSSKPGKTQALNFFVVNDQLSFVDLPGYGYAKVPLTVRQQWGPMIQTYLRKRKTLKLLFFLFDIRRLPNDEDKILIEWAVHNGMATILILTKTDKVKLGERKSCTKKILEEFSVQNLHYLHYSVTKNVGRIQLISMVKDALEGEM
ncbi:MAG: ribosome biogenesis GTP-binding protein YihA/YsxC [Waddliaceae bacterium]